MISAFPLLLAISIAFFLPCTDAGTAAMCMDLVFGIPNYQDCVVAFSQMPYARTQTSYEARSYQLFSEPQFLLPPFTGVNNRYRPKGINQLPKIWRSNSCRVAVMSYGRAQGSVRNALFGTSWNSFLTQMAPVVESTNPRTQPRACGGWTPFLLPKTGAPAAALYVYSAFSPFENVVNNYMSTGYPVVPPLSVADAIALLGNSSIADAPRNISGLGGVPPVAPQQIRLLD